jgi:hypothetical protein
MNDVANVVEMNKNEITSQKQMARLLEEAFDAKARHASYSGGVPGMDMRLPASRYEEVKKWLTEKYGEPTVLEPWYPDHTKGVPPLRFQIKNEDEAIRAREVAHINLIAMMQRADKRYLLLAWM